VLLRRGSDESFCADRARAYDQRLKLCNDGETGWARRFDDEIPLPDGRVLRMLRDAGEYVAAPSKADHTLRHLD
jgi:hypothetical protein